MLAELSIDLKPQRKKVIKQDHDHAIDQEKKQTGSSSQKTGPPFGKPGPTLGRPVMLFFAFLTV